MDISTSLRIHGHAFTCHWRIGKLREASMETDLEKFLNKEDGCIPLIVGILADRDIEPEDREPLRDQLLSILTDLRQEYRHTPFVVFAVNGDTLATDVATKSGAVLVTTDLSPPKQIVWQSSLLIVLWNGDYQTPFGKLLGIQPEPTTGDTQPCCPWLAGSLNYVWNGGHQNEAGNLHGLRRDDPERPPLDPRATARLIHLKVPCATNTAPLIRRWMNDRDDVFHMLDIYNADVLRSRADLSEAKKYALEDKEFAPLPPVQATSVRYIRHQYASADALAKKFKQRAFRWVVVMFVLAFVTALILKVGYYHSDEVWWAKGAYKALLGVAPIVLVLRRVCDFRRKFLDYRALAEGLRIGLYWRFGDIPCLPAEHYPRLQWTDLRWIRLAVRNCWLLADLLQAKPATGAAAPLLPRLGVIKDVWVAGQQKYFAEIAGPREKRYYGIGWWLGWGFVALGALLMFLKREEYARLLSGSIATFLETVQAPVFLIYRYFEWNKTVGIALDFVGSVLLGVLGWRCMRLGSPRSVWLSPRKYKEWLLIGAGGLWGLVAFHTVLPGDVSINYSILYVPVYTTLTLASFLAGFAFLAYLNYQCLEKHAERYLRMAIMYSDAHQRLTELVEKKNSVGGQDLIRQLGIEALAESTDWVELHRQKPEEVSTGD